jgi:hypothetical protein
MVKAVDACGDDDIVVADIATFAVVYWLCIVPMLYRPWITAILFREFALADGARWLWLFDVTHKKWVTPPWIEASWASATWLEGLMKKPFLMALTVYQSTSRRS